MSSLFLSHSHKDKGFIRLLAFDLEVAGVEVWHDEEEIARADSHVRKIEAALGTVKYVGVCLSPNSVLSNWVKKEIDVAVAREINEGCVVVLPLLIKDCQIPLFLQDKLYIDFCAPTRYEAEFEELLRRIKPEALSEDEYPEQLFTVDAARKGCLVDSARRKPPVATTGDDEAQNWVQEWIVDYLVEVRPKRRDGTERHWINHALGGIGGERAVAALWEGLSDENDFARSAAERALRALGLLPGAGER